MAKCKRSAKRPQPKHKKHKKSQHDKCKRLERPNPKRKKTTRAKVPLAGAMQAMVGVLQAIMDGTSKSSGSNLPPTHSSISLCSACFRS